MSTQKQEESNQELVQIPQLSKVQELLRSRRFWAVVLGIASTIAMECFGFKADQVEQVNQVVLTLVSVYVGGISLEETAKKLGAGSLGLAQLSNLVDPPPEPDK